jgi:hypothetical protein
LEEVADGCGNVAASWQDGIEATGVQAILR